MLHLRRDDCNAGWVKIFVNVKSGSRRAMSAIGRRRAEAAERKAAFQGTLRLQPCIDFRLRRSRMTTFDPKRSFRAFTLQQARREVNQG
jgi:hypothetical protein